MDADARSRFWIVTTRWLQDPEPTEEDIPILGCDRAHIKYSKANQSVSVFYTWNSPKRASSVSRGYDSSLVIKRAKHSDEEDFKDIPCDKEWVFDRLHGKVGQNQSSTQSTTASQDDSDSDLEQTKPKGTSADGKPNQNESGKPNQIESGQAFTKTDHGLNDDVSDNDGQSQFIVDALKKRSVLKRRLQDQTNQLEEYERLIAKRAKVAKTIEEMKDRCSVIDRAVTQFYHALHGDE